MKLCLPSKLSSAEGLQTVLLSLARKADDDILHLAHDPEDRIHELRTGMKKYRALLRLASRDIPRKQRKGILAQVRAIKSEMAASRDDLVIFKTIQKGLGDEAIEKLGLKHPHGGEAKSASESLRAAGAELVKMTSGLDFGDLDTHDLCREWKRNVRNARHARKTAKKSEDAADFHEWRKIMKDLWYQSECLAGLDSKIDAMREPAERLSDTLGEEHDHTIVLGAVKNLDDKDRERLEKERHCLRKKAIELGGDLD